MLREIDTNVLIKQNINAHQYMICYMLLKEAHNVLTEYLQKTNTYEDFEKDLKYLMSKSLISYNPSLGVYNYSDIAILPDLRKLISSDINFNELYDLFPVKVNRPDKTVDYLRRGKSSNEMLYNIIVKGNVETHNHIIKCLKAEVKERGIKNSFRYMKRMNTWLTNKEWKNYEDLADSQSYVKHTNNNYGTILE